MPPGFLIMFTDHIMGEDGDKSRAESAPGHDVEDQVRYQKGLQESVRGNARAKNIREHARPQQAKYAAGNERARKDHGCPADTRLLQHARILENLPGWLKPYILSCRQARGAALQNRRQVILLPGRKFGWGHCYQG